MSRTHPRAIFYLKRIQPILKMTDHHEDGHAEEPNLQERVSLIHEHLNTCYEYWALKKAMKDEVVKVKYKASDIQETLPKIMKDLGMEI